VVIIKSAYDYISVLLTLRAVIKAACDYISVLLILRAVIKAVCDYISVLLTLSPSKPFGSQQISLPTDLK